MNKVIFIQVIATDNTFAQYERRLLVSLNISSTTSITVRSQGSA
jgi:hypothetical protein